MKIAIFLFSLSLQAATGNSLASDTPPRQGSGGSRPAQTHDHGGTSPAQVSSAFWTDKPVIHLAGRPGDRGGVPLSVRNLTVNEIGTYSPAKPTAPWHTKVRDGIARVTPQDSGQGGMHWIEARRDDGPVVTVATTVWTFSSKGPSPRTLLATPKNELEIVPQPAVARYREGGAWNFVVRFMGRPLALAKVSYETQNGSLGNVVTDEEGKFAFTVPHDFVVPQGLDTDQINRLQSQFVMTTEHIQGDKSYRTSFNAIYSPDRIRGKSLVWGGGFMLLGIGLATPLLRRRENSDA